MAWGLFFKGVGSGAESRALKGDFLDPMLHTQLGGQCEPCYTCRRISWDSSDSVVSGYLDLIRIRRELCCNHLAWSFFFFFPNLSRCPQGGRGKGSRDKAILPCILYKFIPEPQRNGPDTEGRLVRQTTVNKFSVLDFQFDKIIQEEFY